MDIALLCDPSVSFHRRVLFSRSYSFQFIEILHHRYHRRHLIV